MKPILEIQNVSKKFRVYHEKLPYLSMRDSIASMFKKGKDSSEEFYALDDITFDVMPGESIGIIGKNGAGKSTLLKILSKITPPSRGKIISRGRIASLLEVGTGFHGELSGRENVFLNGSILGMKRKEIKKKFDEIVDFSGVEKFLDTPLKHYSNGMQLRLAFAVAAFLENEILIIDEVLSVGDAEFQKKCLGKMNDISKKHDRTILFVSHNMASMKILCQKGFLLDQGRIIFKGSMEKTIENYLTKACKTNQLGEIPENAPSINIGIMKFKKFKLLNIDGNSVDSVNYLAPMYLYIELDIFENVPNLFLDLRINTLDGIELAHALKKFSKIEEKILKLGKNIIHCKLENLLQPGRYNFTIGVHKSNGTTLCYVENIFDFSVLNVALSKNDDFVFDFKLGYVHFESEWEINN